MWTSLTNLFGGPVGAGLGLFLLVGGMMFAALAVALPFFGLWHLFGKCGVERWRGIVPFHNAWLLCRLTYGDERPFWAQVGCQAAILVAATQLNLGAAELPVLLALFVAQLAAGVVIGLAVARSFGSGPGFGVGLGLLPTVFYYILGLDETEYLGPRVRGYYGEGAGDEDVPSGDEPGDDAPDEGADDADEAGDARGVGQDEGATPAPRDGREPGGISDDEGRADDAAPADEPPADDDAAGDGPAGEDPSDVAGDRADEPSADVAGEGPDGDDPVPAPNPDETADAPADRPRGPRPLGRVWVHPTHR